MVAHWLVIVGALNWGLVGLSGLLGMGNWNLVNLILGSLPLLENLVYLLVGLSGVMVMFGCGMKKSMPMPGKKM